MTTTHNASVADIRTVVLLSAANSMDDIRIFMKEARSLAREGFDVTYIGRGDVDDTVDGVRRIAIPRRKRGGRFVRMFIDPFRLARRAWEENADYYQIHDPSLLPMAMVFKLLGKKVGYDAHEELRADILIKTYLPAWSRSPISRVMGIFEDFVARRLDVVIAATPGIAETLPSGVAHVITNFPISEEIMSPSVTTTREPGKVIYIGGITRVRGIVEMVKAIQIVSETSAVSLTILGDIPLDILPEVEHLDGWKFVDQRGFVGREEVQRQLLTSSCGLCVVHPVPSHIDSVPNKIFEYMAAGLPVVASNFPYWDQFVTEVGSGVLVDPLSPDAIADGILRVLGDPVSAREMGEAGLAAVRNRFNWDSEAEKLIEIIREVTGVGADAGR